MKPSQPLWNKIVAWENLYLAWKKARRGKGNRQEVADFALNLELELLQLQKELINGHYQPGAYRQFTIYERKPRIIAAAPFRDRVVHHAAMNVIEPLIDKEFIRNSYACRKNKGVHKAVDCYQQLARKCSYVLKMDVCRYFPSIDRQILKEQLGVYIKERKVLGLLFLVIDTSPDSKPPSYFFEGDDLIMLAERLCGIPIGNLTSQFFANLYLNELDHYINKALAVNNYIRYVDDMFILSNDKYSLWRLSEKISQELQSYRLRFHPNKIHVFRTSEKVDVLGYKVSRTKRWLRNDNGYRFQRKLKVLAQRYGEGEIPWSKVNSSVQSWIGHAKHAETDGLRKALFANAVFRKGTNRDVSNA